MLAIITRIWTCFFPVNADWHSHSGTVWLIDWSWSHTDQKSLLVACLFRFFLKCPSRTQTFISQNILGASLDTSMWICYKQKNSKCQTSLGNQVFVMASSCSNASITQSIRSNFSELCRVYKAPYPVLSSLVHWVALWHLQGHQLGGFLSLLQVRVTPRCREIFLAAQTFGREEKNSKMEQKSLGPKYFCIWK